MTIPGQEILSADNVGLRVTLAAAYQVTDPYLAVNQVASYQEALYLILQLNSRDVVGALEVDELLARREQLGKQILEKSAPQALEFGVQHSMVNLKDIMFPGELKTIFAQVMDFLPAYEFHKSVEKYRGHYKDFPRVQELLVARSNPQ